MTPKTTEQQEEYNRLVEAIEAIGRHGDYNHDSGSFLLSVGEEDDEEDFLDWDEDDE